LQYLKGRDHFGDLGLDGRILKWTLNKADVQQYTLVNLSLLPPKLSPRYCYSKPGKGWKGSSSVAAASVKRRQGHVEKVAECTHIVTMPARLSVLRLTAEKFFFNCLENEKHMLTDFFPV
jgi:hypothetical protein